MELKKFTNTPVADAAAINELLARYGVKFGIYKNGTFNRIAHELKKQYEPLIIQRILQKKNRPD